MLEDYLAKKDFYYLFSIIEIISWSSSDYISKFVSILLGDWAVGELASVLALIVCFNFYLYFSLLPGS